MYSRFGRIAGSAIIAGVLAACGQPTASQPGASPSPAASASNMAGMDHGGHGGMMNSTATSSAPFDALFIDGMIPHHEGAVQMAQQALREAERPEIKQLAQQIIDSQQREIDQMRQWRAQWYPNVVPTGGMDAMMSGGTMGDMVIGSDTSEPFDRRFIEAMIPHHQSAITMAQMAQQRAEHPEIKQLAGTIISDQQREITQMQEWLQQWYGD